MIPLHEELKEIRLEKGVSLTDISDFTKIRVDLLEDMEQGRFDIAPVPYVRAFLREYAEVVGIDPDRVIARYENKIPRIVEAAPVVPKETTDDQAESQETAPPEGSSGPDEAAPPDDGDSAGNVPSAPEKAEERAEELPADEDNREPAEEPEPSEDAAAPASFDAETEEDDDAEEEQREDPDGSPDDEERGDDESAQQSLFREDEGTVEDTVDDDEHAGNGAPPEIEPSNELEKEVVRPDPDNTEPSTTDTASEKPATAAAQSGPVQTQPRKRLQIDEPSSSGTMFFMVFLAMLIIAAIVIVWMSRSGSF